MYSVSSVENHRKKQYYMGNDKRVRKPEWLKISIGANERYTETKRIVFIL